MTSSSQMREPTTHLSQRGMNLSVGARRAADSDLEEEPLRLDRHQVEEHVQLLRSLDERLREDLGQHLLMTYHVNRHYQRHPQISTAGLDIQNRVVDSDSECGTTKLNEIHEGGRSVKATTLRRRWRAWPLPLDQTPRSEPGYISSGSLQDSLLATMLRYASAQMRTKDNCGNKFSADDIVSEKVCRPATEHIVASLDKLLAGIYRSREGYAADVTIQNLNVLLRKGNKRHRPSRNPLCVDDMAVKRQKTDASGRPVSQIYKQGSQQLMSATDVFQHALVQSFPRGVLQRASERLEHLLQLPRYADHTSYFTLPEKMQQLPQPNSLNQVPLVDVDGMESLTPIFLGTDTERLLMGGKFISRSTWETWDENRAQVAEEGCFSRDGFLEEIPSQGRTNENRRRMRKAKKLQELEAHTT